MWMLLRWKSGIFFLSFLWHRKVSLAVLVKACLNLFPSRNVLIFPPTSVAISSGGLVMVGTSNCIGFEDSVCWEHPSLSWLERMTWGNRIAEPGEKLCRPPGRQIPGTAQTCLCRKSMFQVKLRSHEKMNLAGILWVPTDLPTNPPQASCSMALRLE